MSYTPEQIQKSIQLAEQTAMRERHLQEFKNAQLPTMIEHARASVGGAYGELFNDPLAAKLLPQARVILAMRENRRNSILSTSLGILMKEIARLSTAPKRHAEPEPFPLEMTNQEWKKFLQALEEGSREKLLESLDTLLLHVLEDLVESHLRPVAPPYEIPE